MSNIIEEVSSLNRKILRQIEIAFDSIDKKHNISDDLEISYSALRSRILDEINNVIRRINKIENENNL